MWVPCWALSESGSIDSNEGSLRDDEASRLGIRHAGVRY